MLKIEKITQFEAKASFKGLPIIGPAELLEQGVSWLAVNWDGEVERVFNCPLTAIDASWLEPSDKGGLALFGVNSEGLVVCGLAFYSRGCYDFKAPCYYVVKTNKCYPHA